MREIKFRAWDKNESRMIYSGTEQNDYPFAWMIHNSGIDIAEHDGTEWNYLKELIFMQCTGLHDKNGKEIYEGDIVTGLFNHTDIIGHIVYGSDATFFIERKGLYGIGLNNAEDWLEVVGNIYENPELLESGE